MIIIKSTVDGPGSRPTRLRVAHGHGAEQVRQIYLDLLAGRIDPSVGQVLSMWN